MTSSGPYTVVLLRSRDGLWESIAALAGDDDLGQITAFAYTSDKSWQRDVEDLVPVWLATPDRPVEALVVLPVDADWLAGMVEQAGRVEAG